MDSLRQEMLEAQKRRADLNTLAIPRKNPR